MVGVGELSLGRLERKLLEDRCLGVFVAESEWWMRPGPLDGEPLTDVALLLLLVLLLLLLFEFGM